MTTNPLKGTCESQAPAQPTATAMHGPHWFTTPLAEDVIKAASRTALAAIGSFALMKTGISPPVAITIGVAASIPATLIASGAIACVYGLNMARLARATNSLETLGIAAACVVGGYWTLKNHDILQLGLADFIIQAQAESQAPALVRRLTH